jgi:Ca-activated chloride channel family protein
LVRERLGDASFFAFGIGTSVNRFLIEGLARAGQGEPFVATGEDEARQAAERFAAYVRAPLLQDLSLGFDGFDAYDVEPAVLPDLFAARPIVVHGKYRGTAHGQAILQGRGAGGSYRAVLDLADADRSEENAALRQLWARQRVQRLADDRQLAGNGEGAEEVTALGLRYSLLTEFTSFVAVDTVVRADGKPDVTVRQPLPLPAGVSEGALGGAGRHSVGSASGYGGLGLHGQGAGGGGASTRTLGVGAIGTRGRGGGSVGYGSGVGSMGVLRAVDASSAPRISVGQPVVMGSLDKNLIHRVIQQNLAQLRACYERQLAIEPTLQGRVVLEFVIDDKGRVAQVRIVESTLSSEAVESCVMSKAKAWRFPAVKGGGTVLVRYPIVFKPAS